MSKPLTSKQLLWVTGAFIGLMTLVLLGAVAGVVLKADAKSQIKGNPIKEKGDVLLSLGSERKLYRYIDEKQGYVVYIYDGFSGSGCAAVPLKK